MPLPLSQTGSHLRKVLLALGSEVASLPALVALQLIANLRVVQSVADRLLDKTLAQTIKVLRNYLLASVLLPWPTPSLICFVRPEERNRWKSPCRAAAGAPTPPGHYGCAPSHTRNHSDKPSIPNPIRFRIIEIPSTGSVLSPSSIYWTIFSSLFVAVRGQRRRHQSKDYSMGL